MALVSIDSKTLWRRWNALGSVLTRYNMNRNDPIQWDISIYPSNAILYQIIHLVQRNHRHALFHNAFGSKGYWSFLVLESALFKEPSWDWILLGYSVPLMFSKIYHLKCHGGTCQRLRQINRANKTNTRQPISNFITIPMKKVKRLKMPDTLPKSVIAPAA